jgi:hypothetical protein
MGIHTNEVVYCVNNSIVILAVKNLKYEASEAFVIITLSLLINNYFSVLA